MEKAKRDFGFVPTYSDFEFMMTDYKKIWMKINLKIYLNTKRGTNMYKVIKRILGFIFSLILMPFILLLIIIVGIAIKIEDRGPIFYFADRIGRDGKIFKMFKFRSMKVNAPDIRLEDGSTYNSDNDERVTKVGKFLRKTSIDEIPQAINILKGDMAFVGPRPDSAMWLNNYTKEERAILKVRPGITGYNQAINRNSVGTKEKIKMILFMCRIYHFYLI